MTFRILVTSTGGALAPLNIRLMKQCREGQVWVLAVDQREDASGRYFADHFKQVPAGSEAGYAAEISALVSEYDIDLVLPWSDEEALALAASRESIEKNGAILACTHLETLQVMSDKARSYELLASAGIKIPDWSLANSVDDLTSVADDFFRNHGDFAVKPTQARGNRGTVVIRKDVVEAIPYLGSRELHMNYDTFRRDHMADMVFPVMVMEKLVPPAYDIDILAKDGSMLRVMPRRRLNPAGVPFTGGVLEPKSDLLELASLITSTLDISWLYDYDIMTTQDGTPVPLELNPRPSGSIAAAILGGVPFYEDLIALAKDEPLPQISFQGDTTVIPFMDCLVVENSGTS